MDPDTTSVHHLETAILNGFDYAVSGTSIIIADGLHGKTRGNSQGGWKSTSSEVKIAGDIHDASGMVVVSPLARSRMSGLEGHLKNLANRLRQTIEGKMEQHEWQSPSLGVTATLLRGLGRNCGSGGCNKCLEDGVRIDYERCIACMNCLDTCESQVFDLDWEKDIPELVERMMECGPWVQQPLRGQDMLYELLPSS